MSTTTTNTNEHTREVQVGNLYTASLKQSLIYFKYNLLSLFSKPGVSLIGTQTETSSDILFHIQRYSGSFTLP